MNVGDRVYLNDPRNTDTGQPGTIEAVDHAKPNPYLFRVDGWAFAYWFAEKHLSATRPPSYSNGQAVASRQSHSQEPQDFDKGFGIGGLGRHAENEGLDELIASGKLRPRQPTGNKMAHGQLWEPCPRCGREPVCVECGYCERHCTC